MSYKRTLVTCALPYANGPVHIGHLAGAYIPGDIFVRYLRMRGEDVVFMASADSIIPDRGGDRHCAVMLSKGAAASLAR